MDNPRKALARPTLAMLPRVSDGLSFLYVDVCRIVQTDTGVCAEVETETGRIHRVPIPPLHSHASYWDREPQSPVLPWRLSCATTQRS